MAEVEGFEAALDALKTDGVNSLVAAEKIGVVAIWPHADAAILAHKDFHFVPFVLTAPLEWDLPMRFFDVPNDAEDASVLLSRAVQERPASHPRPPEEQSLENEWERKEVFPSTPSKK